MTGGFQKYSNADDFIPASHYWYTLGTTIRVSHKTWRSSLVSDIICDLYIFLSLQNLGISKLGLPYFHFQNHQQQREFPAGFNLFDKTKIV